MKGKVWKIRVSAGGYTPNTTYPFGKSKTFVTFTRDGDDKTRCYYSHSQTACDRIEKLCNKGKLKISRAHLYHDGIIITYVKETM